MLQRAFRCDEHSWMSECPRPVLQRRRRFYSGDVTLADVTDPAVGKTECGFANVTFPVT